MALCLSCLCLITISIICPEIAANAQGNADSETASAERTATSDSEPTLRSQSNSDELKQNNEDALPYKYYANNASMIFHRPSCPFGKAISISHLELFHFRKEAIDSGYKPCRYCLPPTWTSVQAKILSTTCPSVTAKATTADDKAK
jgi:methylphosphotriester-DNA--protein-cysteine methyltransferase